MPIIQHVSLFSGYEGFALGLRLAGLNIRTVLYCEIDQYCQRIIQQRVRDELLDDAPIWPDVRTLDGRCFAGKVGILTAGFPCQPHSVAGQRRGADDERNLWPDTLRLIGEMGPGVVLLENVPGILANGYAGTVVGQLSEIGYDCQWGIASAAEVGAPHRRDRWWCLASNSSISNLRQQCWWSSRTGWEDTVQPARNGQNGDVAYSQKQQNGRSRLSWADASGISWWASEPPLGRVADGTPHRVGQLRALGNGIVPAVVFEFLRRLNPSNYT